MLPVNSRWFSLYISLLTKQKKKKTENSFYPTSFLHETEPRKRFLYGSNELARPRQKADVEKLKTDNFQLFFE